MGLVRSALVGITRGAITVVRPPTGRQQVREHPSVLRFTQSRVVDRMTAAAALGRPMRRLSACWADRVYSDWRTRPRIRADAGSPMSAETPAAAPFATARQWSVHRHTGKKCRSEQGFREFRQRASPHRPTRPRDHCPVSRRTSRSPRSPAPHHVQGESTEADSRTDPVRRPRAPRFQRGTSQCKRRPQRRGWPHPSDALSVHPPRAARPRGDMERRARGCAPQASWPAWPRPSGSSPRASPAPP